MWFLMFEVLSYIILLYTAVLKIKNLYFIGMIHAGLGQTHVNAFLYAVNIPPMSTSAYQNRTEEVGVAIEKVAKTSFNEAATKERMLEGRAQNLTDEKL